MPLVPYPLLLFSTLLVVGAQLRTEKVHLSDLRESNQGNLRESKRSQELDKNLWEEELEEEVSGRLMMRERWQGRMKAKKERLETQKIERCLLQGAKIIIIRCDNV